MKSKSDYIDKIEKICNDLKIKKSKDVAVKLYDVLKQMIYSVNGREKKLGRVNYLTIDELIELLKVYFGKGCRYCGEIITIKNISLDHVVAIVNKGESKIDNVQFICLACNKRKSVISDEGFSKLMMFLDTLDKNDSKYIKGKLTAVSKWLK